MSTDDAVDELTRLPAVWNEELEYSEAYSELLSDFLDQHPTYADERGYYTSGSIVKSSVLEDEIASTPDGSIHSEHEADLLYAYIRGMESILARLDDKIAVDFDEA